MIVEVPDHVYLIKAESTNYFKVGRTTDIERRIENLSTGCPFALLPVGFYCVPNAVQLEMFLHYQLRRYVVRNEWFDLPQNVVDEIVKNLQAIKLPCDCSTYCMGSEPSISQEFQDFLGLPAETTPVKKNPAPIRTPAIDRTELEGVALSTPNEVLWTPQQIIPGSPDYAKAEWSSSAQARRASATRQYNKGKENAQN